MRRRIALLVFAGLALTATPLGLSAGLADPPGTATASRTRVGIEHSIRGCANRNRKANGLQPLRASRVLSQAARLHARNMARRGFFNHTDRRGRSPDDRVEIFDSEGRFSLIGENIAAGYRSPRQTCNGWMHSAGHRANILRDVYTYIGAGYARGGRYRHYYVQVFGIRHEEQEDPSLEPTEAFLRPRLLEVGLSSN